MARLRRFPPRSPRLSGLSGMHSMRSPSKNSVLKKISDFAHAIHARVATTLGTVVVSPRAGTRQNPRRLGARIPSRAGISSIPNCQRTLMGQGFNLRYAILCIILNAVSQFSVVRHRRKRLPGQHLRSNSRCRFEFFAGA